MTRQHWGAIVSVVLGYAFARIFAYPLVDLIGSLGHHQRAADTALGVILVAIPFAVLVVFTVLHLRRPHSLALGSVRALLLVGWVFAGVVMGLLPYSRMATATSLRLKEFHTAPGFLHGMDVAILVGVMVTVGLLLIALRSRRDHQSPPAEWVEHQFEDGI